MSRGRVRRGERSMHRGAKRARSLSARYWRLLWAVAIIAVVAAGSPASAQELEPGQEAPKDETALVDSRLRDVVDQLERGVVPDSPGFNVVDDTVLVEVHYATNAAETRRLVEAVGGAVNGEVEGWLVQARVPFDQLAALEAEPAIRYLTVPGVSVPIRQPDAPDPGPQQATTGVHVVESNADDWQAAGFDGTGVRVGVIDYFSQTDWNAAVASGDLPAVSGTFCQFGGVACNLWASSDTHGNNVSELIHDMAPAADLYLARVGTVADHQAAVNYFDTQGVDIISRSLTGKYDGPGDGTGPIAAVIDDAVSKGMAWFNSAGNTAGSTGNGSYWRGGWADSDGDDWLDFAPGDELLDFECAYVNGVRWSDWGDPNATDYDVYVYDDAAASVLLDSSTSSQPGSPPLELADSCDFDPSDTTDYLAIRLSSANGGTAGDVIEFMVNGTPVQYSSNPYSASGPASDTANAGAMSVGAIYPATGNTIASSSSRGPTNDARIKPDMTAQSCIATSLVSCFSATSAATPVVAGAAALVLDGGMAATPSGVTSYLATNAAADRGAAGWDNTYGAGELLLPSPSAICPPDDGFEDNDAQAAAVGLLSGVGISGIACDDDWFSVRVTAGATVTADAFFSHTAGDIDMSMWDPTGGFVGSSTSTTDNESITRTATMTGNYGVRVYGYLGAQNTYDLTLSAAICPPDDGFEDNDTQATATGLANGATFFWGVACDDDWYSIPVAVGGTVTADAVFQHAGGDIDMTLHDPTGALVGFSTSVTDDESITHTATMSGDYAARVYGWAGAQNVYEVTLAATGGLTCFGLGVTVDIGAGDSPTGGDDVILGTNAPETIDGLGGNDTICGQDGDDILIGNDGNDTILGDGGNDTLKGQLGNDTFMGGSCNYLILGNAGDDVGFGGGGIDELKGGSGVDTLDGGADDDVVRGGSDDDTLTGGPGNDVLNGGQDFDTVSGGLGDDTVNGAGSSDPSLNGDEGNDLVRGGNAGDTLNGGPGDDLLLGVLGADTLNGGPGNDDLRGGDGTDDVNGDEGDDELRGGNGTDDCDGGVGGEVVGDQHLGGCEFITNIP